ncbi:MAG: response regulator [Alphaproteobacteria bacterium]|nr:response regulator [Alphaproteobacteria bacterium]MBT4019908.1 response regulator [Alphaproteobacteria bacterium]MBT4965794.1 response regulator [Alphaproteobacteria bacterium]MBT6385986.1 response regulator [Alphaproteobacteria bacterium]
MTRNRLENKVFLIVDDDPMQLRLIEKVVSLIGGVKVMAATGGHQALEIFRQGRVDFVLCDLMMFPMDGFELCRNIRKLPFANVKQIPIIVSTGYSTMLNVESARDAGATEILRKPYNPVKLFDRVLSVLDRPRDFIAQPHFRGPDRRRKFLTPPGVGERRFSAPVK